MTTRQYLKENTDTLHALTEALFWHAGGFADRTSYMCFLNSMSEAHLRLGGCAAQSLGDAPTIAQEATLKIALRQDLGRTDLNPPPLRAMDPCFAWGVQYALNGSTIGASFILKSQTFRDDWPSAYLTKASELLHDGATKRFFDALNAADIDKNRATEGACAVFKCFGERLTARRLAQAGAV